MKRDDVERSYHQGHASDPMLNVKSFLWLPDLILRWRDDGHEFSGDPEFWAWLEVLWDDESSAYTGTLDSVDEWARESCWEVAQVYAEEVWPGYTTEMVDEKKFFPEYPPGCQWRFTGEKVPRRKPLVKVWSAGRSGGWLTVSGLPDVDAWDAVDLGKWSRFAKMVRGIVDDQYPYDLIWNLYTHCYEPDVLEPAREIRARCERVWLPWNTHPKTGDLTPPAPDTALSFDEVEAAGLDGTLRSM